MLRLKSIQASIRPTPKTAKNPGPLGHVQKIRNMCTPPKLLKTFLECERKPTYKTNKIEIK